MPDGPPDMPGMAHAQEHMMFRGTRTLATAQLGTIATALGGAFRIFSFVLRRGGPRLRLATA